MIDSTDHITGKTGLTLTISLGKNGGGLSTITPTVTERTVGWYTLSLTTAHTDTLGAFKLHVSATGADPFDEKFLVVAFDPFDAVSLGLSRIDGTVTSRMATFTLPTNFSSLSINGSGLVDITQAAADKVWSTATRTLTSFGSLVANIWDALLTSISATSSIGKLLRDNIDTTISSRSSHTAANVRTEMDANSTKLANVDATVSSRLATSGYTAPDNAGIAAIKTQTDKLVFTNVGKLDVHVKGFDVGVIDAAALATDAANEIRDAIKNCVIEGSYTLQQVLEIIVAAVAGKLSGAGTGTITIRDLGDTLNRIVATVDSTGRTAITLNV